MNHISLYLSHFACVTLHYEIPQYLKMSINTIIEEEVSISISSIEEANVIQSVYPDEGFTRNIMLTLLL